jgi:hypothetical protein
MLAGFTGLLAFGLFCAVITEGIGETWLYVPFGLVSGFISYLLFRHLIWDK